jgi:hypothetical protein
MTDIAANTMDNNTTLPAYITELTEQLITYVQSDYQTPKLSHELFWDAFCKLRYDDNRETIIKNWKYGSSFNCTENAHLQGEIPFGLNLSWEQSYVFGFLLYEFH